MLALLHGGAKAVIAAAAAAAPSSATRLAIRCSRRPPQLLDLGGGGLAFLLPVSTPLRRGKHGGRAPPQSRGRRRSGSTLTTAGATAGDGDGEPEAGGEAEATAAPSPFACSYHAPVMWREVLEHLVTDPQGCYLDCTLGGGGHSAAILSRLDPGGPGRVVALDQDPDALAFATRRLADVATQKRFRALRANFRSARAVVEAEGCMPPGGFTGACVRACCR